MGRHRGLVVFVEQVTPGDHVLIRLKKVKKNYAIGELLEVLTPGPDRREPLCPAFGRCGGCQWQNISYERQLLEKKKIVEDALGKIAKLPSWPEFSVQASPREYGYRHRIQLHIKDGKAGYHAKGSHHLVSINACDIADPLISQEIPSLTSSQETKRVELRLSDDGQLQISENPRELGFTQVNRQQNQNLISAVLEILKKDPPRQLLDLFCGEGNFTLPIARHFPEVTIIASDSEESSIEKAQKTVAREGLKNLSFSCEDSFLTLKQASLTPIQTLVLIDPPRSGCSKEFIDTLLSRGIERVLYISCDPATFARDLELLRKNSEWQIEALAAFDMFPQTPHVELLTLLKKTN